MHNAKSLILVADRELQTRKMLRIALGSTGYRTEEAEAGSEALRLANSIRPDLLILGTNFTDITYHEIIKKVRESSNIPILVISENYEDEIVLAAFDLGIDDYIAQPFNVGVLVARVNAALKRAFVQEAGDTKIELSNILIDLVKHEVRVANEVVQFSPKEYNLLVYLIRNKGKMLTHTQILNKIWGPSHTYDTQYLRVYIGQLRKKIDIDPDAPSNIITESGIGYRMDATNYSKNLGAAINNNSIENLVIAG